MLYCDYCGKSQKEVERILAGNDGAAICSSCVLVCLKILMNEIEDKEDDSINFKKDKNNKCECGGTLNIESQLMSNPPINVYKCNKCGKKGKNDTFK